MDSLPPSADGHFPEGNAIVYCEGAFQTSNGKTAHGLVRFTRRYRVMSVVDSTCAGQDAGELLDLKPNGIRLHTSIEAAARAAADAGTPATHLVMGLAPDGGRLSDSGRRDVLSAIQMGLNVDSGLHDYLTEDPDMVEAARKSGIRLRDVRKQPDTPHFFSGKIKEVQALKIALLGTDSAVGKRTTAWLLVQGLQAQGIRAELVGTGQTAWMQGARHSLILDTTINDFLAGEIEHAVWSAWQADHPQVIVIEGQGSLMNPAYPGGFEILAAGRPDLVILQHAPARKEYDGFPGYPIHPLPHQIQAIEVVSGRPVKAITLNHEGMQPTEVASMCEAIQSLLGLPAFDVLLQGPSGLIEILHPHLR